MTQLQALISSHQNRAAKAGVQQVNWQAYPDKTRNGYAWDQEGLAKVLEQVLGNA